MTTRNALPLIALVTFIGALVALSGLGVRADTNVGPVVALGQSTAAVGPAFIDSFKVTCATTATLIQPSGGAQISYACQTPASAETGGTVLVAVGDSAIADPAFATRNSPVYSGDTVREFWANARLEYCRADTGTVDIFCRSLVTVSTAP